MCIQSGEALVLRTTSNLEFGQDRTRETHCCSSAMSLKSLMPTMNEDLTLTNALKEYTSYSTVSTSNRLCPNCRVPPAGPPGPFFWGLSRLASIQVLMVLNPKHGTVHNITSYNDENRPLLPAMLAFSYR